MKIYKLLKLIFISKFQFSAIPRKKVILFDCENIKNLKPLFKKNEFFVLSVRYLNIKKIYFNNSILKNLILKYSFKYSLKINYLFAIINQINPKLIITHIDNSKDFHIVSKKLYQNINCVAVQMATRGDIMYNPSKKTKDIFIPNFFSLGNHEKSLYKKRRAKVKKFFPSGSLTAGLAQKYFIEKKQKNTLLYDICLISQPWDGLEFPQVKNFADTEGLIAKFTHKLCKEKKLKLIFIGKRRKNSLSGKQELDFYNKYLGKNNFKILQPTKNNFQSYQMILQSKLVVGHNSTLLRESLGFNKKVLFCNFTGSNLIQSISKGILELKTPKYENFKKRVLNILSISKSSYFKKIDNNLNHIIIPPNKTIKIISSELKKMLI